MSLTLITANEGIPSETDQIIISDAAIPVGASVTRTQPAASRNGGYDGCRRGGEHPVDGHEHGGNMNERDELARTIEDVDIANEWDPSPGMYLKYGDAILAAGYRKPRTIETVEELHALAVGSVVLENGETACQKFSDDLWDGGDTFHEDNMDLPATVLWEPR